MSASASRRALVAAVFVFAAQVHAQAPEYELVTKSLRATERARLEAVRGPLEQQPLVRADLSVDVAQRKVTGRVLVTQVLTASSDELLLRTTPNAAHTGAVVLSNASVNGRPVLLEHADETLWRVPIGESEQGTPVTVEVQLSAKVPTFSPTRGDLEDHGAFSASPEVLSLVGVLPMVPPQKADGTPFPAPSGMGDVAAYEPTSFVVSVSVPRGHTVVMPGVTLGEVPDAKGRVRVVSAIAGSRDFPIFVTKAREVQRTMAGEIAVEVHAVKGHAQTKTVLDHAAFAVKTLDARLGPYPFTTLKVVEVPLAQGVGGMEFPGLVTVAESSVSGANSPLESLGLGGAVDPAMRAMLEPMLRDLFRSSLEFTVLHEVAHQYFACLVGNDAVDEPVADEPLTQHTALLLIEWRRGKKAADEVREGQVKMAYQTWRLLGGADGKANQPTGGFDSSMQYAGLVYGKAPLLFDAQRKLVGSERWERALKAYVEQNRYRWVTSQTLTQAVAKVAPEHAKQLEVLRRRWLEEAHGDEDVGRLSLGSLLQQKQGGLEVDAEAMKLMEQLMKELSVE